MKTAAHSVSEAPATAADERPVVLEVGGLSKNFGAHTVLRDVSLKQVVDLTQALGQAAPRLAIPSISIRTPPSDANSSAKGELWNIELTLTGHLYEPKMPASP